MAEKTQIFYRLVKATKGHPFSGLYAVEKVAFRGDKMIGRTIVHEWDLRILAESKLALLGGDSAYEEFKMDHNLHEVPVEENAVEDLGRTVKDLEGLTQRKLNKELKLKVEE